MYYPQQLQQFDKEEFAFVLDFMPTGKSFSNKSEPLVQLLGEEKFTLLEAVPKPNAILNLGERVYIGKNERDKIAIIKNRTTYDDLTETSKRELSIIIDLIIKTNEKKFINLFNTAGPLNIRQHSLDLIPGIGKKYLIEILRQREIKKFESFDDLEQRIGLKKIPEFIRNRIILELQGNERFNLFIKQYKSKLI
ncbi:MAG: DUF655 domain-containing protein [Candidatus Marsarchaeota archaeon]|nr:DUF655 domain-containing protein [Candidatus Marsarchaeota archaeon]MCL5094994.1 DUF655 domain-containing protein [Candidatus Marsarchaeota archaeon]